MEQRTLALVVAFVGLGLFLWNRLPVDVIGLALMLALVLTGLITAQEGISGFANEALITVAAMFVLSAGLVRTGAVDVLGRWLARVARGSELRLLAAAMLLVIPLSAFVNNTPVVAVMIPVVLGLCREAGLSPSRLLMPISFSSQMGGTLTLVGTSTNLLVAGLAVELGLGSLSLFDVTPPASILMVVGVVYLLTVGRWLAPTRSAGTDLVKAYELREYLATLAVPEDSKLAGRSLGELKFLDRFGLEVLAIEHEGRTLRSPGPLALVHAGDRLLVEGSAKDLAKVGPEIGLALVTDEQLSPPARGRGRRPRRDAEAGTAPEEGAAEQGESGEEEDLQWAELIVPPRSRLIGRVLAQSALRERFGTLVLGLQRRGTAVAPPSLAGLRLAQGDLLLVQARATSLMQIHEGRDLTLIGSLEVPASRPKKLGLAVAIMLGVVGAAAFGVVPILVAALIGCLLMFVTGCVTPEEAYQEVDWSVLVLIGTMLPMGLAMQRSGAAAWVAETVLGPLGAGGPQIALGGFYLLTSVFTEMISNNAAAVVLMPIALAVADGLGVSPWPFVVAVMLAASNSFMTPIGYQTNLFVYGPGGYRFVDFVRVGGPLNLLLAVVAMFAIPWFFPFARG
jgi:di/tricarboxylate transporter